MTEPTVETAPAVGGLIWRYATLGGAPVIITRDETAYENYDDCFWQCLGCGAGSSFSKREWECQAHANRHAGDCHALPPVREDPVTDPAVELLAGLAGIRQELAGLTAAVRDLTTSVVKSGESLPDIADAISDTPDHSQVLGDIATAVESLATDLDRPRRSWLRRRCNRAEVPA